MKLLKPIAFLAAGLATLTQAAPVSGPNPAPENSAKKHLTHDQIQNSWGITWDDFPAVCQGTVGPSWCPAIRSCIWTPDIKMCHAAAEIIWEYEYDGNPFRWSQQ